MLATVALLACLLGGAAAQDFPIGRTAYMQLMSVCLGETSYRNYLDSVAGARRECGGGVDELGFFPGLGNVLINPAARFPPVQGAPFLQPGPAVLQRPPGVSQLPGVLTRPRGVPQQPGPFFQPSHFITPRPGVTPHPTILNFPQESGISSVLDSHLRTTPVATIDSVRPFSSPVGPPSPGIRQKRTVALNLADIQQTRENMNALIKNFTCVLKKLAVVDNNLELNHQGLTKSVFNLPVAIELKQDLINGINYCRSLAQCLPLDNLQLPVPHKLKRIMNYVKCEKEVRLDACHKQNLRQNLQNNLGFLPRDGSQFNTIEEIVTLLADAQSAHELELI